MEKITAGEFRNFQYNEVKKLAFVMACLATMVVGVSMVITGGDNLLRFLSVVEPHKIAFVCFLFLVFALTLWFVYFAAKEQANNKLWLPDDTYQLIDYKTKGVME